MSEIRDEVAQLALGIFVILGDRQFERVLEEGLRVALSTELNECFSEKDPRHHPIGFLFDAVTIMGEGGVDVALGHERLRQAEMKHLVGRLACDERLKVFNPGGHRKKSIQ